MGFAPALYFSLEALTTLGFGEITPTAWWLRFLVTLEALFGLALVTACVSWIVLLYPALSRMRLLARGAVLLSSAAEKTGVSAISSESDAMLLQLAMQVVRTRVDLIHFPILYYFYATKPESSLARALPLLFKFSEEGRAMRDGDRTRLSAAMLRNSMEDLGDLLNRRFLGDEHRELPATIEAFRADHQAGLKARAD